MSVKTFSIGPAKRKAIDKLVREAAGKGRAVEAALDKRHTAKPGVYSAYERFLLSDGCTVFVSLETMKATVSAKPNKRAVAKVERLNRRKAERAARKQAREAKRLEAKARREAEPKARAKREANLEKWAAKKGGKQTKAVKVKAAKVKATTIPIVKYDPKLPTLEA